jgi:hypothetical protein
MMICEGCALCGCCFVVLVVDNWMKVKVQWATRSLGRIDCR